MSYKTRVAETTLHAYLKFFSIVGVMGPRQSGKSSLLRHVLTDYRYVSFDNVMTRQQFYDDPALFMRIYNDAVIFDEAQKVPEIFDYLKLAVDDDRDRVGKFVVSGSSQFNMMRNISESLAGRIGLMTLLPFQFSEISGQYYLPSIYCGAYPELINKDYALKEDWFSSYLDTYLTKDVRDFGRIGDIKAFQSFISLLAANVTQLFNASRYAGDLGVDVKTIQRWLSILEASYIIFVLPPYYNNLGKRIVKSSKIYFYDTGIVSFLTGIQTFEQYDRGSLAGPLFENYIISEVLKRETHGNTKAKLYFLRTSNGVEIDLIVDRKTYREWIEIKKSETFRSLMAKNLHDYVIEGDKGYVLYNGRSEPYVLPISILNYKEYLTIS